MYRDVAISGTVPVNERPAGFEMLEDAKRGTFDTMLLYKLDRIGRKLIVVVDAHDRLEEVGVAMRSATEPTDSSTPAGRLIFQMLASFAQFERETIAERVREGVRRSLKDGKCFGVIPYGYDITETGEFVVVEEEAARVREIFTNIAGGGTPQCRRCPGTRAQVPWQAARARRHLGPRPHPKLHPPVYTGHHVVHTKRGELDREVPAIVPEEIARAARARLAENKLYSGGRPKNKFLLRGPIKCGCCDVSYTGFPGRVKNETKTRTSMSATPARSGARGTSAGGSTSNASR